MIENSALGPARLARALWRKSSHSGTSGTCVEIAGLDNGYRAVRDSKDPTGPALALTGVQWSVFTAGVRAGEFD